jgi:two-component system, LytTR family, response regulator
MNVHLQNKPASPPPFIYADKQTIDSKNVVLLLANINYTYIYLQCGKVIISTQTLKRFDEQLSRHGFIRVHKSAIINPAFITDYSHPEIKLTNGLVAKVSRRRKIK